MDLGAFSRIEDLSSIAAENGISVPRLRGYRLMKDEKPMDVNESLKSIEISCVEELCTAIPFWHPDTGMSTFSSETDKKVKYYIRNYDWHGLSGKIRWDRIHGWKRRVLKTHIKNETKKYLRQAEVWNKYVGRDDVLYIHARIGGWNWAHYHQEVDSQPWFLEKVDDAWDGTYCDIYALIKSEVSDERKEV